MYLTMMKVKLCRRFSIGLHLSALCNVLVAAASVATSNDSIVSSFPGEWKQHQARLNNPHRRKLQTPNQPSCDWIQQAILDGDAPDSYFGIALAFSMDGNTLAVGASRSDGLDGTQVDAGLVQIFARNRTTGELSQLGQNIYGDFAGDNLGQSVALSGDGRIVAIGAFLRDATAENSGQVRVYQFSEEFLDWRQIGQDINGMQESAFVGGALSLSADGTILAVAKAGTNGAGTLTLTRAAGLVRVYRLVTSDDGSEFIVSQWEQMGNDITGTGESLDLFGFSVSLSENGRVLAVGATGNDATRTDSGQVTVVQFDETSGWSQVGNRIDGLNVEGGEFGISVSISADGLTVAAGASGNINSDPIRGYARVFELRNDQWIQVGDDIFGLGEGDRAGRSIELSADGKTLIVGSPENDGPNGINSGHARIFRYENTLDHWVQVGRDISGEGEGDELGRGVAIVLPHGDAGPIEVAVGARLSDGNGLDSGRVSLHRIDTECVRQWLDAADARSPTIMPSVAPTRDPSCEWKQKGFDIDGKLTERLGEYVVISGDGRTLAVGGLGGNGISFAGFVKVFTITEEGIGPQLGDDIVGKGPFDLISTAIDISDDGRILVTGSSPLQAPFHGYARVFQYSLTQENWIQLGSDLLGEREQDEFGTSVSVSADGTIVAIGAPFHLIDEIPGGQVRVFRLERNEWVQFGNISGNSRHDELGSSVSLSADGMMLAVGARGSNEGAQEAGRLLVYNYTEGKGWIQVGNAIDGQAPFEGFGYRVKLSADGNIVTSIARPRDGTNTGKMRVFKLLMNREWTQLGNEISGEGTGEVTRDSGLSISLSEDGAIVAVGTPGVEGETGAVIVYRYQEEAEDWVTVGGVITGEAIQDQFGVAVSISVLESWASLAIGARFNNGGGLEAGHARLYSIETSCLSDDSVFVPKEAEVQRIELVFIGIGTLTSGDIAIFEAVTKEWYDDFFTDNIPAVKSMKSNFNVKSRHRSFPEGVNGTSTRIIYSQRISYVELKESNYSVNNLLVLPFENLDAANEYLLLLKERITAFLNVMTPIEPPVILTSDPSSSTEPTGQKTRGFSTGVIIGIVAGALGCVLMVTGLVFYRYKANLPVGEPVGVDEMAPSPGISGSAAYRVDEAEVDVIAPLESSFSGYPDRDDEDFVAHSDTRLVGQDVDRAVGTHSVSPSHHIDAFREAHENGLEFRDQCRIVQRRRGPRQDEQRYNAPEADGPEFKDHVCDSIRRREPKRSTTHNTYGKIEGEGRGPEFKDQVRYPEERRRSEKERQQGRPDQIPVTRYATEASVPNFKDQVRSSEWGRLERVDEQRSTTYPVVPHHVAEKAALTGGPEFKDQTRPNGKRLDSLKRNHKKRGRFLDGAVGAFSVHSNRGPRYKDQFRSGTGGELELGNPSRVPVPQHQLPPSPATRINAPSATVGDPIYLRVEPPDIRTNKPERDISRKT